MPRLSIAILVALLPAAAARAEIVVRDDEGTTLRLPAPAARIVSLAPNVTEELYAAGAGDRLVGAVEYSDYPEAARRLPRIGSSARLDLETIVALKPDLAIGWSGGNGAAQLATLRRLGVAVYLAKAEHIDDVADQIERFGILADSAEPARAAAAAYRQRIAELRSRYRDRAVVPTFYQIWHDPLMTIGGRQVISDVIKLCGGANVFAELAPLAATVSIEAVLAANPEAIIASGNDDNRPPWLDEWRRWPALLAARRDNLFVLPPDLIQRHTPRLADGAARMCELLDAARRRRPR